jgi:hypothetical protein
LLHLHINAVQRTRPDRDSNAITADFWCLGFDIPNFLSQRSVIMPTIQEGQPAKARGRNRKDRRSSKSGQPQVEVKAAEVKAEARAEADPVSAMVAETEAVVAKAEAIAVETPVALPEKIVEAALSGEVLPPEVRAPAAEAAGFQAIAQAYGEYTRNSWLNGRLLTERLIAVRSFDEAIEIQGEFARESYANFLNQSQKMCVLYGEWAQQFFRPLVWRH